MRVLVTNDDGIDAPGLHVLARAMADMGHDLVVAASLDDRTGSGAAVGPAAMTEGIPVEHRQLPGLPEVQAYGLEAPPALIVLVSMLGVIGDRPELVVSGINPGANTGRSLLHSGTVGAALTASNLGLSALAVSLSFGEPLRWETAGALSQLAVGWLAEAPPRTVLNLNVPNLALRDVRGVRWASLAPFGTVRTAVTGTREGRIQVEFRPVEAELEPDSDTALVAAGYASVTTIAGVRATDETDVADLMHSQLTRAQSSEARSGGSVRGGASPEDRRLR